MTRTAWVVAAAMLTTGAAAQARMSTTEMSCNQASQAVLSRGAIVLGTGGQTYDRFVSDRRYCEVTEVTTRAFVPTRDNGQCFIGYRCKEPGNDWFGDDE